LLTLELDTELDPRRIDQRAREIAGLQDASPEQIIYLPREGAISSAPGLVADATEGLDGHP
jgi:hypothetical protein